MIIDPNGSCSGHLSLASQRFAKGEQRPSVAADLIHEAKDQNNPRRSGSEKGSSIEARVRGRTLSTRGSALDGASTRSRDGADTTVGDSCEARTLEM